MDRLPTRVNRADPEFSERKSFNLELIKTLRERLDAVSYTHLRAHETDS